MKKLIIILIFFVLILIGLQLDNRTNEIGRYQLQNFIDDVRMPKILIDTKTGDIWILTIEDGINWKKIRDSKATEKDPLGIFDKKGQTLHKTNAF